MLNEENIPVLVGAAQLIERETDPRLATEPLRMLEKIGREAARNAGAGDSLLAAIDTVGLVPTAGWSPQNAPALVGEALGAKPRRTAVVANGGEAPLKLLAQAVDWIAEGSTRIAFLAGCNNWKTLQRALREKLTVDWTKGGSGTPEMVGVMRPGGNDLEKRHGLAMPIEYYPVLENALRGRRGASLEEHARSMGRLMEPFTRVAARNPYAWFPTERTAQELVTPGPGNRMVGFPYPKFLNSVLDPNQSAGVLLVSAAAAREFGIPEDRWVHWWGGTQTVEDQWFVSERADLSRSHSLRRCAEETFARTGTEMDDFDFIDFYSCFPVAVEHAAEAFGIAEDDPRGLTTTGGLPYAGGPGSNYPFHSLATTMDLVRDEPGSLGLVTGNGMYLSKHSSAVVSTAPRDPDRGDPAATSSHRGAEAPEMAEQAEGRGSVESYTVMHGHDGRPELGIVLGRLEDGRRFVANTPSDADFLSQFVARDQIGCAGRLSHSDGINRFEPI